MKKIAILVLFLSATACGPDTVQEVTDAGSSSCDVQDAGTPDAGQDAGLGCSPRQSIECCTYFDARKHDAGFGPYCTAPDGGELMECQFCRLGL